MGKSLSGAIVMALLTASVSSADVQLQLQDGRVSIVAKDATVRQILAEWARVGQTKVVNVERIPGGPLTIELSNVPEAQALDVLLRSVSGYMAAPRGTAAADLSMFDRIIVMPTITNCSAHWNHLKPCRRIKYPFPLSNNSKAMSQRNR